MHDLLSALILGLVEGATEFIPVSSTGHLILVGHWLGFTGRRADAFEIFIQLGAILAVVWQYRALLLRTALDAGRDAQARGLILALFVAFLPAAIVGLATHHWITEHLFRPRVVAIALVIGGIAILLIERRRRASRFATVRDIGLGTALGIGLAQVAALMPGISRSGATIMGALLLGVARPAAAEFSFLLAIPVMFAATVLGLWGNRDVLSAADLPVFATGFVTAFASALVVVRWLIGYVSRRDFTGFAWYRIAFGIVLLGAAAMGWMNA